MASLAQGRRYRVSLAQGLSYALYFYLHINETKTPMHITNSPNNLYNYNPNIIVN